MQGGGRSFFKETTATVAAGVVAKCILKHYARIEVLSYVSQVHNLVLPEGLVDHDTLTPDQILGSGHESSTKTGSMQPRIRRGDLRVCVFDREQ
ncbi:chorismate synthase, chloroplastic-like isoform X2 [Henckelia pumila]|uniref:chorismate synthase, chloroplastic-like isoform X2 n=1 Tax=Henckelia pumila TaxID=405737 RepID=UPI003C6E2671